MRFDPAQPVVFLGEPLFDLRLPQPQHSPELVERWLVVEEFADLVEAEAEIAEGQESVQATELRHAVRPVAGGGVDAVGAQQAELVVVPQHPRRDVTEASEVSDVQHDDTINSP